MKRRGFLRCLLAGLAACVSGPIFGWQKYTGPQERQVLEVGPGRQYATLQTAIKDAWNGDVIYVYPGLYEVPRGPINIRRSVSIIGVDGARPTFTKG